MRHIDRGIIGTWFLPDDPARTAKGTLEIAEKDGLVWPDPRELVHVI